MFILYPYCKLQKIIFKMIELIASKVQRNNIIKFKLFVGEMIFSDISF